jgi:xylose isomerase
VKGNKNMGLRFTREFKRIIDELSEGILKIDSFYELFEMTEKEWVCLSDEEKKECARTLADDIFYALGMDPIVEVAQGQVQYYRKENTIKVTSKENILGLIQL